MINTETRLGDFLDFGQLFKAFGSNSICPNLPHFLAIYAKVSKSIIFLVKSFLGNFDRHLASFYWSHWRQTNLFNVLADVSITANSSRYGELINYDIKED